jgi:glutathione S-transferase
MIAFKEKNLTFEGEIVNMMNPQEKEKYRQVYPLGKIPFLVLDNDWKIPESTIIIEYLENHFLDGTKLIPDDKDLARQARFHDRMTDLYFANPLGSIFFNSLKSSKEQNPQAVTDWKKTIDVVYGFMNKHLEDRKWILGEHFSLADCAMAPNLNYARQTHPYEQHTHISDYWNRLAERPSVKKVLEEAAPFLEAFMKTQGS